MRKLKEEERKDNRYVVYDEDETLLIEGNSNEVAHYLNCSSDYIRHRVSKTEAYCYNNKYTIEMYQYKGALI